MSFLRYMTLDSLFSIASAMGLGRGLLPVDIKKMTPHAIEGHLLAA
ncbi:hypothetical protein MHI37_25325 [Paenibacillus sp. FSL H8-0548]|nr:hypothetical protein [Paenibacillus sp. FSL H8-0548]